MALNRNFVKKKSPEKRAAKNYEPGMQFIGGGGEVIRGEEWGDTSVIGDLKKYVYEIRRLKHFYFIRYCLRYRQQLDDGGDTGTSHFKRLLISCQ